MLLRHVLGMEMFLQSAKTELLAPKSSLQLSLLWRESEKWDCQGPELTPLSVAELAYLSCLAVWTALCSHLLRILDLVGLISDCIYLLWLFCVFFIIFFGEIHPDTLLQAEEHSSAAD